MLQVPPAPGSNYVLGEISQSPVLLQKCVIYLSFGQAIRSWWYILYIYIYTHTHTCKYIYIYIYIYRYVCVQIHIYIYIYVICICVCICMCVFIVSAWNAQDWADALRQIGRPILFPAKLEALQSQLQSQKAPQTPSFNPKPKTPKP